MKLLTQICAVLLTLSLAACATAPLRDIPLLWQPTKPANVGAIDVSGLRHVAIRFDTFRDVRKQPQLIAENREDPTPKPVTTLADVGAFVTTHVRQVFDKAGLETVTNGGKVVLSGEVRQFFVVETGTYRGMVTLQLTLRSSTGEVLWRGNSSGTSEHSGGSYSAQNYYQSLSDAVVNAATALLENAQFRQALGKVASAGA